MYKKNVRQKGTKGITLIALIITIIVMLILVAVTISMAINGGLFGHAGKAVGDMQNAINAEQQLADGKIKIGDKWYASIDDYIAGKPITTGIEINPTEILLKKKETADVEGEEVLTATITASVFGMESEPEITWEKSSDAITLSATTGKSITVEAVGTQNAKTTVTAKCTYEGEDYTAECKVTLEMIKPVITASVEKGAFVEYNVEYTDVYYDTYEYSSTNGWRLLNYTDNRDGTISNVELISTGLPAKLYYRYDGSADWWVTDKTTEFKTALQNYYGDGTRSYAFNSDTGYNVYASAGMYYNFENIPFYTESNYNANTTSSAKYNLGWYRSIKKNGTEVTENTNGSIFLTSNDYSVRMLTLPEINNDRSASEAITSTTTISSAHEPAAGLYVLQNIKNISELSSNTYSNGYYWLASPYVSDRYHVRNVSYSGSVGGNVNDNTFGVRPVVCLGSEVTYSVETDTDEITNITYLKLSPTA